MKMDQSAAPDVDAEQQAWLLETWRRRCMRLQQQVASLESQLAAVQPAMSPTRPDQERAKRMTRSPAATNSPAGPAAKRALLQDGREGGEVDVANAHAEVVGGCRGSGLP